MSETAPLAKGIYFDKPREGAPSFVKGRLSIKVTDAIEMLNQYKNDKDYVNLDLLQSKDKTKLYLTVNTWKPEAPSPRTVDEDANPF